MFLRQFLHRDPVAASYLFGCAGQGLAAVVDPVGPVGPYVDEARAAGARITFVVDTHLHADHLSAGPALAEATGARYLVGAGGPGRHDRGEDGQILPLGNVVVQVLHTPGHTPEHVCLLISDRRRADEPWFVLTGHTLMVGDLGRTELATSAEAGARALFRSVQRLAALPDHVEVLPGAYAGSTCGRGLSGKPWSTIGFEKRHNEAFRISDERAFVAFMTRDVPPPPAHAQRLREANAGAAAAAH